MKGFGFLLIALVSSYSLPAQADHFPAGAKEIWSQYFPGDPFITDPELDLEKLLNAPESCKTAMRDMVKLTVSYGQLAFRSKKKPAQKAGEKIQSILNELENKNDSCFESVARTYLLTSLHILEPRNVNVGGHITGYSIKGRWIPQNLELTLLGAALLNQHLTDGSPLIKLLTPKLRSNGMSSIWNERAQGTSEFLVSAGYDCGDRQILIDPFAMPLNLAATFVHELDHLFRDRVKVALTSAERTPTIQENLPLAITLDETLASVMAAYYQRHMRFFHDFKPRPLYRVQGVPGLSGFSSPLPFKLTSDLTLFRDDENAPINQIWHLLEHTTLASGDGKYEINPTPSFFLFESFLRGDPGYGAHKMNAPLDAVHAIYQTIHRGYFNGTELSPADLQILDPSEHGLANDSLSFWLARTRFELDSNMNSTGWTFDEKEWYREVDQKDWQNGGIVGVTGPVQIRYAFTQFFKGLDDAFSQILTDPKPSLYCEKYIQGLENGELKDYVGNRFHLGETGMKPGETGVKPGETGVKPGETGVKPGETGVKPGETGVKPGETGVKPSLVKPCLNIGREL